MEQKNKKIINYQNINYRDIAKVVNIKIKDNDSKFDNWLSYKYEISKEENSFSENLINKTNCICQYTMKQNY